MSRLPQEDVNQLWRQMGDRKDWPSFMKEVMTQGGRTIKLENLMVDHLVREAYDLNNKKFRFPASPDELYQVLTQRMLSA